MGTAARVMVVVLAVVASLASTWNEIEAIDAVELYGTCVTTYECVRAADECAHRVDQAGTESSTGICTVTCAEDVDCPDGGRCVPIATDHRVCAAPCGTCEGELVCVSGACVPPL